MLYPKRNNLVMRFRTGVTEDGKLKFSSITIPGLRLGLTDEEIHQICDIFHAFVKHELVEAVIEKQSIIM